MNHKKAILMAVVGLAVAAPTAQANAKNSIQPGRTFFHTVTAGQHPNKLVILHNGTGIIQQINHIGIAGSGGYVFTLAANTVLLSSQKLPRCTVGMVLPAGTSCAMDVRVHTTRPGWWRSVLSVTYTSGNFNSGELEAHVVAAS